MGVTWVDKYDRGGNILSKARYAYTTGALGLMRNKVDYTYWANRQGEQSWLWKDVLVKCTETNYDANGVQTGNAEETPYLYDAIGDSDWQVYIFLAVPRLESSIRSVAVCPLASGSACG